MVAAIAISTDGCVQVADVLLGGVGWERASARSDGESSDDGRRDAGNSCALQCCFKVLLQV